MALAAPIALTARLAPTARLALLALLTVLVAGCGGDGGNSPGSSSSASPSQRPSRAYKDGHLTFTVLSLRCGLRAVAGTHSEAQPDGQFCSARLRVENKDPEFHTYEATRQRVAGVTGDRSGPDPFAMAVRRQSEQVRIGGHALIEVELWYDLPEDADVTGLRVSGDNDPSGYLSTRPVGRAPDGVFVPMKPLTDQ